jgi:integrase
MKVFHVKPSILVRPVFGFSIRASICPVALSARKHKLIDENPFSDVKIPTANVTARQRFIDRDTIQKLLDAANPTWRIIIALARFGGLRCPSEVLSLEWRHVDWERGRLTVPSPKTDRYEGKESRVIPLFPELRAHLQEADELAEPGQTHVIGGDLLAKAARPRGWRSCNLRTTFGKSNRARWTGAVATSVP